MENQGGVEETQRVIESTGPKDSAITRRHLEQEKDYLETFLEIFDAAPRDMGKTSLLVSEGFSTEKPNIPEFYKKLLLTRGVGNQVK